VFVPALKPAANVEDMEVGGQAQRLGEFRPPSQVPLVVSLLMSLPTLRRLSAIALARLPPPA